MTSLRERLLPCPFCGGEPTLRYIGNDQTASRKIEVKCSVCRVGVVHAARRNDFAWLEVCIHDTWNSRAALPAQDEPKEK